MGTRWAMTDGHPPWANSRFLGLQDQGLCKNECYPEQPFRRKPSPGDSPTPHLFPLLSLSRYHNTETNMSLSFCEQKLRFFNILASRTFWRVQSSGIVQYLDCLHCASISRCGYTHFLKMEFKILKASCKSEGKSRCSWPSQMGRFTRELPENQETNTLGCKAFTW